jgi:hypothetical protein
MGDQRQRNLGMLTILSGLLFLILLALFIPIDEIVPLFVYVPILGLLAAVLYSKGIKGADPDFPAALFISAFVLRLAGAVIYYYILYGVYGYGDANAYHKQGLVVSEYLRQGDLSILGSLALKVGSARIAYITGFLYTLFPRSMIGASFFFTTLSFTGSVFFYRAFRLAFPEARPGFYRLVIFFLPSLLFWPSTIGKEAWILFGSGFVAYGLARYARELRPSGLILAIAGILIVYLPRPHFAAFMILAMGPAFLLFHRTGATRGLLVRLAGVAVIAVLGVFLLRSAGEFLELGDLQGSSIQEVAQFYEFRQEVTMGGGSSFAPATAFRIVGIPSAFVTILFRPFVWEARSMQALLASVESMLWLGLFWSRRRSLLARLRSIPADPWLAFAFAYSVIVVLALTVAGNFGIITRQRVTFLPFLWVLFA